MSTSKARQRTRKASRRPSVLVVDDEPGTVEVLIAVLNDHGIKATGAAHGRDALAKLERHVPDLILLDYMMPVLDGAELVRALKEQRRLAKVPIVIMSGVPESMVKRRCRGYDAFLRKPFSLDDLQDTIDKLLQR